MCTSRSNENMSQLVLVCFVRFLHCDHPNTITYVQPSVSSLRICDLTCLWAHHADNQTDSSSAESLLELSKKLWTDLIATVALHGP